jgi:hypothetical protein
VPGHPGVTPKAVTHRVTKLKADAKAKLATEASGGDKSGFASAPKKPRKKRAGTEPNDDEESPAKKSKPMKVKPTPKKRIPSPKEELSDEDEPMVKGEEEEDASEQLWKEQEAAD